MADTSELADLAAPVRARFTAKHEAREEAYRASRDVIRAAANAIRAIHRSDVARADELLATSQAELERAVAAAEPYGEVFYGGFLQDAAKEYAEARLTRAAVAGDSLPGPEDLNVDDGSWLHGLAETVGELRRECLDHVRRGRLEEGERLLALMEEILSVLAIIDVPDGLTRGLRRQADAARAITERTRGDLTTAAGQRNLRHALDAHRAALERVLDVDQG